MKRTKFKSIFFCITSAQEGHCQDRLKFLNKKEFNSKKGEGKMKKTLIILAIGSLFITQLASAAINQTGQIAISLRLGQVVNEQAANEVEGARIINDLAAGIDSGAITVTDRSIAEKEGAAFLDFINEIHGLVSPEKTQDVVEIRKCAAAALQDSELGLASGAINALAQKWADNIDSMLISLKNADEVLDDTTIAAVTDIQE